MSKGVQKRELLPGEPHNVRTERRRRALERHEVRAGRSPNGQLAELDRRLGLDVGAVRERARLQNERTA